MFNLVSQYARWLHTRNPAGLVEKLPIVHDDGSTNVPGVFIVGDLAGVPLLKFSADTGARVVSRLPALASDRASLDLIIIGGGVSGMSAALEAKKRGLKFLVLESAEPFSTIVNFPKAKPIYTYPVDMTPAGSIQFRDDVHPKEQLLEDLRSQCGAIDVRHGRATHIQRRSGELVVHLDGAEPLTARHVIIAIGRSGNFRKLGVDGESLPKVYNRLHDPAEFAGQHVLVVGGGDSALEASIALADAGAIVTHSYRKAEFARPKPDNLQRFNELDMTGRIRSILRSNVQSIRDDEIDVVDHDRKLQTIRNDAVFVLIGREPPLDFFRRSGIRIHGERSAWWWVSLGLMLALFTFLYQVKKSGTWLPIAEWWEKAGFFPYNLAGWLSSLSAVFDRPAHLLGTFKISSHSPGFWFSVMYTALIVWFGVRRIRRRKTPYVTLQTTCLMLIQVIPLFLLPYILLPWMGHNGAFDAGFLKTVADNLFPAVTYDHGREYWRAFGFILAWPLFIWNVFSGQPMMWWLIISLVQTFVIIPAMIYFWGKGAYCGWVCSCGAMAETLGDTHRQKMPHGPIWNRLNMIGQFFLLVCFVLLFTRIYSWAVPTSALGQLHQAIIDGKTDWSAWPVWLAWVRYPLHVFNYVWFVDLFWAGILGFGLYFHFSGRVWCRFACPLAALMHIYAKFSHFAIVSDKKKCISCNVCTSVCHQGIDVMSFANKGKPMQDVQCVRCSACVQMCPTGVLSFGQVDSNGTTTSVDRLPASLVQITVRRRRET
jgi:NosR/NirI family transcriptional regulator, nitrous oxide reductase regulator